jgi:hypothetical protein
MALVFRYRDGGSDSFGELVGMAAVCEGSNLQACGENLRACGEAVGHRWLGHFSRLIDFVAYPGFSPRMEN